MQAYTFLLAGEQHLPPQGMSCSAQLLLAGRDYLFAHLCTGYETTASALAFTVYHVAANHAKVEAKLLAEVDDFGCSTVPTYDDLAKVRTLRNSLNACRRQEAVDSRAVSSFLTSVRSTGMLHHYTMLLSENTGVVPPCPQFPYLNAVWLEALRLSPPGALGTIRLACEAQDVGGYGIPEGTSLIVRH